MSACVRACVGWMLLLTSRTLGGKSSLLRSRSCSSWKRLSRVAFSADTISPSFWCIWISSAGRCVAEGERVRGGGWGEAQQNIIYHHSDIKQLKNVTFRLNFTYKQMTSQEIVTLSDVYLLSWRPLAASSRDYCRLRRRRRRRRLSPRQVLASV